MEKVFIAHSRRRSLRTCQAQTFETNYLIKQLAQAGVQVWSYMSGRCLTPRSSLDKAMSTLQGFGDEVYREGAAARTHEALGTKAKSGYVTGGRVFGYRNEDIVVGVDAHGRPLRSHVVRVIVQEEAAVVLELRVV